ncbi:alanine racemase [Pseudaeromonas sharmana]|uniref:Alanine racemase n=1 Tax=Pseudaeromonas sharmana TaxID=328412 RepID=A0ABV8CLS2_9GAMM
MQAVTAEINTGALQHNFEIVRQHAPRAKIVAVVKANAYGHDLLTVARTLKDADAYAVARIEEALALRSGGIVKPVIMLEGFFSADDLPVLAANNLQTAVHSWEQLEALERAELSQPLYAWMKLDTGMHRLGVRPEEVTDFYRRLSACKNVVQPFNLMTHFSCADELDNPLTREQIDLFTQLANGHPGERALANSAAVLAWQDAHADWIRPGIMLYGISPFPEHVGADHGLQPVMTLKSNLIAVRTAKAGERVGYGANWVTERDTRLGVVAMGYGDGYPRMAPNGTPVLINGRIVPTAGRVSMDMMTVDLGPDANDKVGDDVVLWGDGLPVELVAQHVGTIPYELVLKLTPRVRLTFR